MWEALIKIKDKCDKNTEIYGNASRRAYRRNQSIGIVSALVSAVVGASVFGTAFQQNPDRRVQFIAATLAIANAVLSVVQSRFNFESRSAELRRYSSFCFSISTKIDLFLQRYRNIQISDSQYEQADKIASEIIKEFQDATANAPTVGTVKEGELRFLGWPVTSWTWLIIVLIVIILVALAYAFGLFSNGETSA